MAVFVMANMVFSASDAVKGTFGQRSEAWWFRDLWDASD